jgi:ribonucleoside-diphosphate reductase alpha chain
MGPELLFADDLHQTKYREPKEDFRGWSARHAGALSDGSDHYHAYRDATGNQRFPPRGAGSKRPWGRPAGSPRSTVFVSGTIMDSFVDGAGSIMGRANESATTMRMGGGDRLQLLYAPSAGRPDQEVVVIVKRSDRVHAYL